VSAQIISRAPTWQKANELARRVYNTVRIRNTTINDGFYREIQPTQEPFDLPLTDRGQVAQVFNVTATKRSEEVV